MSGVRRGRGTRPAADVTDHLPAEALAALDDVPASQNRLSRDDWTLTEDVADEVTTIASYQVEIPTVVRNLVPTRAVFPVVEEFQTNTTGGDTETFSLANDIIDTPNTRPLALFDSGSRVFEDSIDFANDTFDYTNPDASADNLHAFYIARDPVEIEIYKVSPTAMGGEERLLWSGSTGLIHERDQNEDGITITGDTPLSNVIPTDWTIEVRAEGSTALSWDDSDEANSQSNSAPNAILSLPVNMAQRPVAGLGKAVRRDNLQRAGIPA